MNSTSYADLLKILDETGLPGKPRYFSLEFVECDVTRDKGGDFAEIPMGMIYANIARAERATKDESGFTNYNWRDTDQDTFKVAILKKDEYGSIVPHTVTKPGRARPETVIRTVHTRLITKINSQEIVW